MDLATNSYPPDYLAENIGWILLAVPSVMIAISTIAVALRFWARCLVKAKLRIEDWLMIPSLVVTIALSAVTMASVPYGGAGSHIVALLMIHPERLAVFGKFFLAFSNFYLFGVALPKISMLYTFLRIFVIPWQRRMCYVTMAVIIGTAIADLIVLWNMCSTLAYVWDTTITGVHCIDINAFCRWGTFPNIVTDVVMILLPLPTIFQLHLSWKDKVGVLLTFLAGGGGLVTSILRFRAFYELTLYSPTNDVTYNVTSEGVYSILECTVYIVCACLPAYRGFYVHLRRSQSSPRSSKPIFLLPRAWSAAFTGASRNDTNQAPPNMMSSNHGHPKAVPMDSLDDKASQSQKPSAAQISIRTDFSISQEQLGVKMSMETD